MADWEEIPKTEAALLRFDPNSIDLDPSGCDELLTERFGVTGDADESETSPASRGAGSR